MNKRIVSGIVGGLVALIVLVFGQNFPFILSTTVAIISVFAMREIFTVMGIANQNIIVIPTLIFVPIFALFGNANIWQIMIYIYTLFMFSLMIIKPQFRLKDIAFTHSMAIIISMAMGTISMLRNLGGIYGSFYVFLALITAWMSDTGAYFSGKLLGKNKLCPDVSPKKTIEGFFGGIITCIISLIIIASIFNNLIFPEKQHINYFLIILMGLIGSMISTLGDLCFSVIKRKYGVKDFGNFMPGHGGILDRFDSVIFVAPYVFFFLKFIKIIH